MTTAINPGVTANVLSTLQHAKTTSVAWVREKGTALASSVSSLVEKVRSAVGPAFAKAFAAISHYLNVAKAAVITGALSAKASFDKLSPEMKFASIAGVAVGAGLLAYFVKNRKVEAKTVDVATEVNAPEAKTEAQEAAKV